MSHPSTTTQSAVRASVILAPIIAASLLLLPIYVGGLITEQGLSLKNALSVVSLEMWGMAVSLLPAIYLMKRVSWKTITRSALCVMIVAFAVPMLLSVSYEALASIRFIGGIGAGTAMAVIMATIGRAEHPDKAFSWWVLTQVIFKVIGIFIIARLLTKFGMNGFFLPLGLLCLLALPLASQLPGRVLDSTKSQDKIKWSATPIMALVGVFVFYVAISALWANFERIGTWSAFDSTIIANVLSFTSLASLAGASFATILAGRAPRSISLAAGLLLLVAASLGLGMFSTLTVYTVIGLIFAFAWFFSVPYLIASVNANDSTGQLMVFTNSAIAIGLAAGPAIAGALITGEDYKGLTIAGSAMFIAALILLLPSNRQRNA